MIEFQHNLTNNTLHFNIYLVNNLKYAGLSFNRGVLIRSWKVIYTISLIYFCLSPVFVLSSEHTVLAKPKICSIKIYTQILNISITTLT